MSSWRVIGVAACLLPASLLHGAFPRPSDMGFHHCVLIYDADTRSTDDLMPYVAEMREEAPRRWLFDAFLFLMQRTPTGKSTTTGPSHMADWRSQLARWFTAGRDLDALDKALSRAESRLGPPPSKRRIILSIPAPQRKVTDFGDVDGDGRSEDLSSLPGVSAVMTWYVEEIQKRFREASFENLDLWGVYWMRETIPSHDEDRVREAAAAAHAAGLKLLWIPWFQAAGWDRWRACDIDIAIMQPNYAFFSRHHGAVRRNRLAAAADLARGEGLGVEIELPMFCNDPTAITYFIDYLAAGAAHRHGYQRGATAYYLGRDNVERLSRSERPWQRRLYRSLAAYISGETVNMPSVGVDWMVADRRTPSLADGALDAGLPIQQAIGRLATPGAVSTVDVFLHESREHVPFSGLVKVACRVPGTDWTDAGWTLHPGPVSSDGLWQVVTVPVRQRAQDIRVELKPAAGSSQPHVQDISITAPGSDSSGRVASLSLGCPYQLEPTSAASYGDTGHELTDAIIPEGGFMSGQTVGWNHGLPVVSFDLGEPTAVESIQVHVEGGGYAGVCWPAQTILLFSRHRRPPQRLSGTGPLPHGLRWTAADEVVVDDKRTPDAMTGHVTCRLPEGAEPRFVNVLFKRQGWLMLSEIRIVANGRNIAHGREYALQPSPSPKGEGPYPDDGIRLTDGVVARSFLRREVTGWNQERRRHVTVDLCRPRRCRRVTAWTLAGGRHAIHAPEDVSVAVRTEARGWLDAGKAQPPEEFQEAGGLSACPFSVILAGDLGTADIDAVRVTVVRERGWTMLSEIQVE